jgi:hypothetical protein
MMPDNAGPIAPRAPSVRDLHGEQVTDDYAWMRDPEQPELRDYLAAERAYYDARSRHLGELAAQLADETASRVPAADEYSVSWPLRDYSYRTRVPEHSDNRQHAPRTKMFEPDARRPTISDGQRLRRDRRERAESRRRAARLVGRHQRGRDLRASDPRPAPDPTYRRSSPHYTGVAWSADSRFLFT